ncbi:BZ3500_MvSof-1268-A1-R1_Chr2-1g04588 [Microbotryum saponariae]|uniref:BZ3500_MvSof-1268-A1-R1_Chr2-1g04588 protein n=1 Tax=Microbotryum saponariae TaxID=289078 RepID=A0A2X0KZP2_9BASI|nr:BZ3500_MvSof-1268-A1-R1_Chr2-1g04588 [Microbotryum saponariae]SCZ92101.1 BZ3501_MvSof-1269-A2-R1_Chr2-1g04244 [Microbotryum saponariae]
MPAKIAVIYYSTYGHVRTLAESEAKGAKEAGADVTILQFPETLNEEIRGKMHAAPLSTEHPTVSAADLELYDGFLLGFPTRYGRAPAQVSAFFDQTGGQWARGALFSKFAGVFTSSASQHGGQETTALTTIPFFAHHGISYVPIGFAAPQLTDLSEVVGGSAWGAAGVAAGDGSRAISEKETAIAKFQGKSFANLVNTFVAGKSALAKESAEASTAEEPIAAKAIPASAAAATTTTAADSTPYQVEPEAQQKPLPASTATHSAPAAPALIPVPAATANNAKKSSGGFFCCGGKSSNYDS